MTARYREDAYDWAWSMLSIVLRTLVVPDAEGRKHALQYKGYFLASS